MSGFDGFGFFDPGLQVAEPKNNTKTQYITQYKQEKLIIFITINIRNRGELK